MYKIGSFHYKMTNNGERVFKMKFKGQFNRKEGVKVGKNCSVISYSSPTSDKTKLDRIRLTIDKVFLNRSRILLDT